MRFKIICVWYLVSSRCTKYKMLLLVCIVKSWIMFFWYSIFAKTKYKCSFLASSERRTHDPFPVDFETEWIIQNTSVARCITPQALSNVLAINVFFQRHNTALSWWRHEMETFSALLAICVWNSPVSSEFPAQRPVTRSFDVYFDVRPNKGLSKQSWGWWFETLSCSLWRHRNVVMALYFLSLQ